MADNLVELDLSRFTKSDLRKIADLGEKMRLMRRWFRHEMARTDDGEEAHLYSGDRGPRRYAHYWIGRGRDGTYTLITGDPPEPLAEARAIDSVLDAIPQDFYYTSTSRRR